jgi:hypothetical protein
MDSDGNQSLLQLSTTAVGVGIAPSYPLHVGSGSSVRLEMGGNTTLSLGAPGTFSIDQISVPGGRFVVMNNGNAGFGQPNPQYTVDVSGTLNVTSRVTFSGLPGTNSAPSSANLVGVYVDTNTGQLYFNNTSL